MKSLDLSQQACRVPLGPIPPASEKRVQELGGDLMNLYRVIGHNPNLLAAWIGTGRGWPGPRFVVLVGSIGATPMAIAGLALLARFPAHHPRPNSK